MGGYLAGYGGKTTKKINQMFFDEGYIEKAAISWCCTDKPRLVQKELLAKFKEDHGALPSWNIKKKLSNKTKVSPAPKPKKTLPLKTNSAAPKVIASSVPKPVPKPKISPKKPVAKEQTSAAKTESASKGETSASMMLDKEKPKTEAASAKPMTP
jgi:hypothetical protein